jgi:sulfur transfer protein SufE
MNLAEREAELIEIFEWIEDETDRYVQIMDYGKKIARVSRRKSDRTK